MGKMIICAICGREVERTGNSQIYCPTCKLANYCINCGCSISLNSTKCRKCAMIGNSNGNGHKCIHTQKTKDKISKAKRGKNTGKDNPRFGKGATKGSFKTGHTTTQDVRDKISATSAGRHYSTKTEFTSETFIEQMKLHPELIFKSSWEIKFIEKILVKKFGYSISDIVQQKFICNHPFDIFIKSRMMLIEIDGLWCHKGEGKYDNREKDKQDSLNAIRHGYAVTRFDDADLKKLGVI